MKNLTNHKLFKVNVCNYLCTKKKKKNYGGIHMDYVWRVNIYIPAWGKCINTHFWVNYSFSDPEFEDGSCFMPIYPKSISLKTFVLLQVSGTAFALRQVSGVLFPHQRAAGPPNQRSRAPWAWGRLPVTCPHLTLKNHPVTHPPVPTLLVSTTHTKSYLLS